MKRIKTIVETVYRQPEQRLYWSGEYLTQADRAEKMGFVRYHTWRNSGWWELTDLGRKWIENQEMT